MLVVIVLTLCLVSVLKKWLTLKTEYWVKRNTKQVNGLLRTFVTSNKSMPEIVKDIYDDNPEEPHIGTYYGMQPSLILKDTRNIQAVLHGDFLSFYGRGIHSNANTDYLSDNLFFIDDYKRWKLIRHKMSSVLSANNLENIFTNTERCAKDFVEYIMEHPQINDNPHKAIYYYITACISSLVFGVDENTPKNIMQSPSSKIAHAMSKPSMLFNLKFAIFHLSPKLYKLLNLKVFADIEDPFIQLMKEAIERRRSSGEIGYDFIQTCIHLEDAGVLRDSVTGYETDVNMPFLAAQAFGFFIGGIDTTSNVLHFTLSELSRNPKILKKVHDEIDEVFINSENSPTFEDVDKLKYMEMVFYETVRKYPPVGAFQRKCCKDTVLPINNLKVEKDTLFIIPTLALHNDKKYFPNPDVFDPERFSATNISKIIKYSFVPFCEGKRNCIGRRVAILEYKLGLAWLLRKYTVEERSHTPIRFDPNIFILRDPTAHYKFISRFENCAT